MSPRDLFVRQCQRAVHGDHAVVPLADFLIGNDDTASIAPNLIEHPGMPAFRRVFGELAQRLDVESLWAVVELEHEAYPDDEWPFAAYVLVVTSAEVGVVQAWVSELQADPCSETSADELPENVNLPPGYRVVLVWWD